ncbi:conjugal transfer protein TrbM, partial [Xanthomonas perforans]
SGNSSGGDNGWDSDGSNWQRMQR